MNRREFLKTNVGLTISSKISLGIGITGMLSPFKNVLATGNITGKKIVVLNLTGGNDTANAFPPIESADASNYYTIRPTIAIPDSDIIRLNNNPILGMHPSLRGLEDIWNNGDMALFPATHCGANPNRSHFNQFVFYARGGYTSNSSIDGTGYLARYLNHKYQTSNGIEAFDFSGYLKNYNASNIPVLILNNPDSISFGYDKAISNNVVNQLKSFNAIKARSGVASDYKDTQGALLDRISTLENTNFSTGVQNSASYPSSTLGRQLKQAAGMLRNLPELEMVNIVKGGWDTHSDQGGKTGAHANLLQDIGDGIKAFYDDLGADKNKVMLVINTEFGRTAAENGSKGTDHGHASAWFVIGGGVKSQFMDSWSGFKNTDLVSGRFTAQATDYRDIYSGVFKWAGLSESQAESCFPEYSFNDLNFIT
jgi:uncharacterized protein (DUF1501 family)